MRKTPSLLTITIMAASLTGCQLFDPRHGNSIRSAQASPDMSSYFDQRLADGRRHLRAGRLAAAITAYRQASYSAEHAAAGYNGMAIAYDKLGRADLAHRYFDAALALAPEDASIARNLARFEERNPVFGSEIEQMLAIAPGELTALTLDEEKLQAIAGMTAPATAPAAAIPVADGRLVRVGNRELRIRSREDWASRVTADGAERPAVVHVGQTERTRMAVEDASENYPVRVQLGEAGEEPRARTRVLRGPSNGRNYPVRVSIPRG